MKYGYINESRQTDKSIDKDIPDILFIHYIYVLCLKKTRKQGR